MQAGVAVDVRELERVFTPRKREPVVALDGVSLTIPTGEVHGMLGPNGAGKTTLVKILSTVLLPTSGTAQVLGHDVVEETRAVRPLIGIVFGGERGLYTRLTARQNLEYWGALYRLSSATIRQRSAALLERVGLVDRADQRVEEFSRGMKQRLHLARGLMGDAKVLFLDEPTTGMDPIAGREFRSLIAELKDEGRTILLTTHDMVEARFQRIDVTGADDALLAEVAALPGVSSATPQVDGSTRIEVSEEGATAVVLRRLVDGGVTDLQTSLPSLEEVYIQAIGERGLGV